MGCEWNGRDGMHGQDETWGGGGFSAGDNFGQLFIKGVAPRINTVFY
jgi:hypothetical protein